jgi:WD40 repeat protein
MVLIFSANANTSAQIKREVERAVNKGIPVIPFRIEDVAPTETLEYFISTPHWLDAFTPPLERHLEYLAEVARKIVGGPEVSAVAVPERESREKAEPEAAKLAEKEHELAKPKLADEKKATEAATVARLVEERRKAEQEARLEEERRRAAESTRVEEERAKAARIVEAHRLPDEPGISTEPARVIGEKRETSEATARARLEEQKTKDKKDAWVRVRSQLKSPSVWLRRSWVVALLGVGLVCLFAYWNSKPLLVRSFDTGGGSDITASFSPDNQQIATAYTNGGTSLWEAKTGKKIAHWEECNAAIFSPDGNRLLGVAPARVIGVAGGGVTVCDAKTGKNLLVLEGSGNLEIWGKASFSPDGNCIVAAAGDAIHVWDAATGKEMYSLVPGYGDKAGLFAASFSPDNKQIVTGSDSGGVLLWDTKTRKQLRDFSLPSWVKVWDVGFSPDGNRILASAEDGVHVWDAATSKELYKLEVPTPYRSFVDASFSPDGKWIVSSGPDYTTRVWDAETRKELVVLREPTRRPVSSARFSPDGKLILTVSHSGDVRLWRSPTAQ